VTGTLVIHSVVSINVRFGRRRTSLRDRHYIRCGMLTNIKLHLN